MENRTQGPDESEVDLTQVGCAREAASLRSWTFAAWSWCFPWSIVPLSRTAGAMRRPEVRQSPTLLPFVVFLFCQKVEWYIQPL